MAKRDYYKVLEVTKKAGADQIKKAYRKLARKHHPDVNPGDKASEERFKEIQEAYEILKNPEKRENYDRFGSRGPGFGPTGQGAYYRQSPYSHDFYGGPGQGIDMEDLLGSIFGRKARTPKPKRGMDIESEMTITLEDALNGLSTEVKLPLEKECSKCGGQGSVIGKNTKTCTTCKGSGRTRIGSGPMEFSARCNTCGGLGKTGFNTCGQCSGHGVISEARKITVKIPAGIKDGSRVRVARQGEPGQKGAGPGDLLIKIHIKPHPIFKREGKDLTSEKTLPFNIALLGGKIDIKTIDGTTSSMKIPPGTQGGQKFRLKGKGMPKLKGAGRGDQFVTVRISVPRSVNDESKKLIEKFEKLNPPEGGVD